MKKIVFAFMLALLPSTAFATELACALCNTPAGQLPAPYPLGCPNMCSGAAESWIFYDFPHESKLTLNDGTVITVSGSYYRVALSELRSVSYTFPDGTVDTVTAAELIARCKAR